MAIPDPIPTQTVNSVTYDLARVGFEGTKGVFQTADQLNRLTLSHQTKNRIRSVARVDRTATVADPLTSGNSFSANMAAYVVIDRDKLFTPTDADWCWKLLKSIMDEGTPDYSLRFLKGEV